MIRRILGVARKLGIWVLWIAIPFAFALLVWLACTLIGGEPEAQRLLYAGIALAVAAIVTVGVFLVLHLQDRARTKKLEQGLVTGTGARLDTRRGVDALRKQWREHVAELKSSKMGGGGRRALTALPWFVIIGQPASGKSTLLRESKLEFPIGRAKIAGLQGTANCDWWFANNAVFLDTAGRFVSDESAHEWGAFLDLLRKCDREVNGVIVAVPVADLLQKPREALDDDARRIRTRLDELMDRLGVNFPVWVVFTKADLLGGFVEFFGRVPAEMRDQMLGWTLEASDGFRFDAPAFAGNFAALVAKLRELRPALIESAPKHHRAAAYAFPEEFAEVGEPAAAVVRRIFEPNAYQDTPLLRGVYFTSGTQVGWPLQHAAKRIAELLGVSRPAGEAETPAIKQTYFVNDLVSQRILEDRAMTWVTQRALDRGRVRRLGMTLTGCAVSLFLLVLLVAVYAAQSAKTDRLVADLGGDLEDERDPQGMSLRLATAWEGVNEGRNFADLGLDRGWEVAVEVIPDARSKLYARAVAHRVLREYEDAIRTAASAGRWQELVGKFRESRAAAAAFRSVVWTPSAAVPAPAPAANGASGAATPQVAAPEVSFPREVDTICRKLWKRGDLQRLAQEAQWLRTWTTHAGTQDSSATWAPLLLDFDAARGDCERRFCAALVELTAACRTGTSSLRQTAREIDARVAAQRERVRKAWEPVRAAIESGHPEERRTVVENLRRACEPQPAVAGFDAAALRSSVELVGEFVRSEDAASLSQELRTRAAELDSAWKECSGGLQPLDAARAQATREATAAKELADALDHAAIEKEAHAVPLRKPGSPEFLDETAIALSVAEAAKARVATAEVSAQAVFGIQAEQLRGFCEALCWDAILARAVSEAGGFEAYARTVADHALTLTGGDAAHSRATLRTLAARLSAVPELLARRRADAKLRAATVRVAEEALRATCNRVVEHWVGRMVAVARAARPNFKDWLDQGPVARAATTLAACVDPAAPGAPAPGIAVKELAEAADRADEVLRDEFQLFLASWEDFQGGLREFRSVAQTPAADFTGKTLSDVHRCEWRTVRELVARDVLNVELRDALDAAVTELLRREEHRLANNVKEFVDAAWRKAWAEVEDRDAQAAAKNPNQPLRPVDLSPVDAFRAGVALPLLGRASSLTLPSGRVLSVDPRAGTLENEVRAFNQRLSTVAGDLMVRIAVTALPPGMTEATLEYRAAASDSQPVTARYRPLEPGSGISFRWSPGRGGSLSLTGDNGLVKRWESERGDPFGGDCVLAFLRECGVPRPPMPPYPVRPGPNNVELKVALEGSAACLDVGLPGSRPQLAIATTTEFLAVK